MTAVGIGVAFTSLCYLKELRLNLNSTYIHKIVPFSNSDFGLITQEVNNLTVTVLQVEGPLFFASIEPLINVYATAPKHEMLIIDMSNVTMIDLSGVYALEDLVKSVKTKNIKVIVSNVNPDIKEVIEKLNSFCLRD